MSGASQPFRAQNMPFSMRSTGFWVALLSLLLATAANLLVHRPGNSDSTAFANERGTIPPSKVIREGTTIPEMVGEFRIVGERIHFIERETNRTFRCLENLMLQRVHQVIGDDPGEISWIVAGSVTEYREENFLVVEMTRRTK
jgi:hypothetical protein